MFTITQQSRRHRRQIEGKTFGPGGSQASAKTLKNIMVIPYEAFKKLAEQKNVKVIKKLGAAVQEVNIDS